MAASFTSWLVDIGYSIINSLVDNIVEQKIIYTGLSSLNTMVIICYYYYDDAEFFASKIYISAVYAVGVFFRHPTLLKTYLFDRGMVSRP